MNNLLFHIFQNNPLGRESLEQSLYFCQAIGAGIEIYIPKTDQCMMYFDQDAVQLDLDCSYLCSPQTAKSHALALAEKAGIQCKFFTPDRFTASGLPDIPTAYAYMCCPRSFRSLSHRLGSGHIGLNVRRIIKSAAFTVFIPSNTRNIWKSITVFYDGSSNANKALEWGLRLSKASGFPLDVFTHTKGRPDSYFKKQIAAAGLSEEVAQHMRQWRKVQSGRFEEYLWEMPLDTLLVMGACGHGLIKDFLFGSKMDKIQSWMPNCMLLVGHNCSTVSCTMSI